MLEYKPYLKSKRLLESIDEFPQMFAYLQGLVENCKYLDEVEIVDFYHTLREHYTKFLRWAKNEIPEGTKLPPIRKSVKYDE